MLFELFNVHSCVSEVIFCAARSAANNADTSFKEYFEVLMRVIFVLVPLLLDKSLQLGKKLFNRIQVWRIRWQINQFDACVPAHLPNPFTVMK